MQLYRLSVTVGSIKLLITWTLRKTVSCCDHITLLEILVLKYHIWYVLMIC